METVVYDRIGRDIVVVDNEEKYTGKSKMADIEGKRCRGGFGGQEHIKRSIEQENNVVNCNSYNSRSTRQRLKRTSFPTKLNRPKGQCSPRHITFSLTRLEHLLDFNPVENPNHNSLNYQKIQIPFLFSILL
jgi:hypothetical protein